MKREYVKPYIVVESFQLNAAIAGSCTGENIIKLHHGLDNCDAVDEAPGLNYFGDVCVHDVKVEGDGNDQICYHGPESYLTVAFDS